MEYEKQAIAVIGSGISGLAAAWLLSQRHDVTLYEAEHRLGGHSHTVDVTVEGKTIPVDTGFLVCNDRTYPNLLAMFKHLDVELVASDMSFSVQIQRDNLEWSGTSLATLFGDKLNLFRPKFWRMVMDVLRFNRQSLLLLTEQDNGLSLGEYLARERYSEAFKQWYLLPMAAAIWSCPTTKMLDFPATTLIRFFKQHGLLQVTNRPQWMTVKNGSRSYVEKLRQKITHIKSNDAVTHITRDTGGVTVTSQSGVSHFDQVVLACHSDQALAMLSDASAAEASILDRIKYQPNRAVLHTDAGVLPSRVALWSAWNFHTHQVASSEQAVSLSYLINKLQPLTVVESVIVTLNPQETIPAYHVLADIHYAHPVLDCAAIAAQTKLPDIQGVQNTWFCGAWTAYGFHEDGLKSALNVANQFGIAAPWQASI
ncbi:MAG: FAD-dependent oxidoreductase [Gallionella sp.]